MKDIWNDAMGDREVLPYWLLFTVQYAFWKRGSGESQRFPVPLRGWKWLYEHFSLPIFRLWRKAVAGGLL